MHWVVGDIQGCVREFDALLRAIAFDAERDQLVCAGDLINRGPESLETLRLWRSIGGRAVLGNHEVYTLCARAGAWPRKHDTLESLFAAPDCDELLASLRELPVLLDLGTTPTGREVWVVHAGLHPDWHNLTTVAARINDALHDDAWLQSDDVSFATRVRCCDADGTRTRFDRKPEDCPAPFAPWDALYSGDALIVHGHWAWRGHYRGDKTIGLDSGCVYGGPLTAWCVEDDRVVQVPARG